MHNSKFKNTKNIINTHGGTYDRSSLLFSTLNLGPAKGGRECRAHVEKKNAERDIQSLFSWSTRVCARARIGTPETQDSHAAASTRRLHQIKATSWERDIDLNETAPHKPSVKYTQTARRDGPSLVRQPPLSMC